jgi:hypothetical protein
VYKHRRELAAAERELNPEFCPDQNWAAILDRATVQSRRPPDETPASQTEQAREQDITDVLAAAPSGVPADRVDLLDWLVQALAFADTEHDRIVEVARLFAEQIQDITPDDLPASDRRLRRRLEKLKRALEPAAEERAPESVEIPAESADPEGEEEVSAHWSIPAGVRDRVVPFTRGKRALFITNRNDSELRDRLAGMLELQSLDLAEGEERRIDAAVKSIGAAAYDMVLGATGFMNHKSDERISRACRRAGINYVRVDRGRPLTCLLALAKNFGIELENIAQRVAGTPRQAG